LGASHYKPKHLECGKDYQKQLRNIPQSK